MIMILPRRATAAVAALHNPVLGEGERGYETDTKRWKTGDGSTHWNDLPYDTLGANNYLVWTGTAWPARPTNGLPVIWVGGVAPTNAPAAQQNGDVWIPASGDGQPLGAVLEALQLLTATPNKIIYFSSSGVASLLDLETETTLASNSDTAVPSQKAVKTYIDAAVSGLSSLLVNPQTGTAYTLAASDNNKLITMTNGLGNVVTIPLNTAVPIPVGFATEVASFGGGQTSFAKGDSSIVVYSVGSKLKLTGQYSSGSLVKIGTDTWFLNGDLSA